jgi:hypothetical protein
MSGATRDFALFTLPLIYLRPDLAKEMLRFLLRSQDANTGAFPYAHVGHGKCTGFVVHSKSSDLDLFVFCALAEYLGATRDIGFLDEDAAFYPPAAGRSGTVLDHVRASFGHLEHRVGLGPHGVLRCGTGDWNDALMAFSRCYPLTLLRGESAFNAGLAAFALPLLAGAIESKDANLARRLRDFGDGQARALKPLWMGDWVARGYLGYANSVLGRARLFLDTQAFGVLGGVWDRGQIARLFARIEAHCVEPEPAGARCMWPPMKGPFLDPGSDTNGGTWAAIDAWTAWAWLAVDPARAWPFFLRTTLAAHAEAYPHIWYGVWSGPDSFNAAHHRYPGETFDVTVTPMIDYPVMNMNRHMGPLLAAIKFAGIQPRDGTLIIDPRVPLDAFAIRLPLIGAAYLPDRHRGYYTPVAAGDFRFAIRPPRNLQPETAALFVNGNVTPFAADSAGLFCFEVSGMPGKKITWELR